MERIEPKLMVAYWNGKTVEWRVPQMDSGMAWCEYVGDEEAGEFMNRMMLVAYQGKALELMQAGFEPAQINQMFAREEWTPLTPAPGKQLFQMFENMALNDQIEFKRLFVASQRQAREQAKAELNAGAAAEEEEAE